MIQEFVDQFMANKDNLQKQYSTDPPTSYSDIVSDVVKILEGIDDYEVPDPSRITAINHGEYQGTILYIIGADNYQPSKYWSVFVDYGSCSGCDTFEGIWNYRYDGNPTEREVEGYMTLALHIVQGVKEV